MRPLVLIRSDLNPVRSISVVVHLSPVISRYTRRNNGFRSQLCNSQIVFKLKQVIYLSEMVFFSTKMVYVTQSIPGIILLIDNYINANKVVN